MTIKKETAVTPKTILFCKEPMVSIGCQVTNTGVAAGSDGKKIIKAGTPVGGDTNVLLNRQTALVVTNLAADGAKAQGVLLHDVDVTAGATNATLVIFGYINPNKLDVVPVAEAVTALAGKITLIKD